MKILIFFIFLFSLLTKSEAANSPIGFEVETDMVWGRIWRGMNLNTQNEINSRTSVSFSASLSSNLSIGMMSEATWALSGRQLRYQSQQSDEWISRLYAEAVFFAQKSFEVIAGVTYYHNLSKRLGDYGADVPEPFLILGIAHWKVKPMLHFYVDLTPLQSGLYWVLDFHYDPILFAVVPLHLYASYGGAQGFLKVGERLLLGTLLPRDLLFRTELEFKLNPFLNLKPHLGVGLSPGYYANSDLVTFSGGLSVSFNVGLTPIRQNIFR